MEELNCLTILVKNSQLLKILETKYETLFGIGKPFCYIIASQFYYYIDIDIKIKQHIF